MAFIIYLYILSFFAIYIYCFENDTNIYINSEDNSIYNGIYIIRNEEGTHNLEKNLIFTNDVKKNLKNNFALEKYIDQNSNVTEDYFYIKHCSQCSEVICVSPLDNNKIINSKFCNNDKALWKIIPKINENNKLIYYVQNKDNKKFWELEKVSIKLSETTDLLNLNTTNEFLFIELYKEVKKKESKLLENEPIDVLIKYIDLSDRSLNRTGIHQIVKDEDHQELRYSVRSILKNIPWIRKIFILMPNEKVRYFKEPEEIKEKIIYIKDKDLLGFDSASIYTFHFNLNKMKNFNISENFILMDDDYFIGGELDKSNFFYEENGTILPALVTSDYYEIDKRVLNERMSNYLKKRNSNNPHSDIGFYIHQANSLLALFDIFGDDDIRNGKKMIEPSFTHNAIPVKLSDLEEIHNDVKAHYKYAQELLFGKERQKTDLQFHTFYMAYIKNKYDRKVSMISSSFYDLTQSRQVSNNRKKLFVINTGSRNYRPFYFEREVQILKSLFPEKTKYELDNDNDNIFNRYIYHKVGENQNIYAKINKINDNISIFFNEFEKKIDKSIKMANFSKALLENKEDIQKLTEEITLFKLHNDIHVIFNYFSSFLILIFLIYKIIKYQ